MRLPFLTILLCLSLACTAAEDPQFFEYGIADLPDSAGVICEGEGSSAERCAWQSSGWSEDMWLDYPFQATLDVSHDLGRTPTAVFVYLSFSPTGEGAALAAGDLARVIEVTSENVVIQNATNGEYYCRIVLQ